MLSDLKFNGQQLIDRLSQRTHTVQCLQLGKDKHQGCSWMHPECSTSAFSIKKGKAK